MGHGSPVAGHQVRDAGLPAGCVVVTVQHNGVLNYATGSTEIAQGDVVSALVPAEQADRFRHLVRGEDEPPGPEDRELLV
ncbi:MAG: TrkA C-terminal domain-containing protein [Acidimicrobiales bacterium]